MELLNVVTIDEAKGIIDSDFKKELESERVSIAQCTGRIVSSDIKSDSDVPGFDRSTVDGYAVRSKDLFGASESMPSILNLKGEVKMGEAAPGKIKLPGDCMYVPTGGMLPEGADSVIMIEYTDKLDENTILANSSVAPGDNVIKAGEDIKSGEVVISRGSRLRPYEVGVLASLGVETVEVYRMPEVAIISTGDEIVSLRDTPGPGQVRDINTYLLYSSIQSDGGKAKVYGLVKDDYELLKNTVREALEETDIVLISGGSSAGKKDHTLKVIDDIGDPGVLIHGLSAKPGKPTIIGKAGEKIIFGLPGHPLACAVIYNILVKYYLNRLMNFTETEYPVRCRFSINYHKAKGREEYLPVTLRNEKDTVIAEPVFAKSGLITGFSKAWGYIRIERNIEGLKEGQEVFAYKF